MSAPSQGSSSETPLLLGVDGGGTSTVAWLAEPGGTVLGRGKALGSNAKAVGEEIALRELLAAIRGAFEDAGRPVAPVDVACLGLAGFDRPDDRRLLDEWCARNGVARRLVHGNDGDLVIAAGTLEGWGVGVIAGTGSIAVGRTADGRTARAGGWGHLIGDEGSAFDTVRAALRWVARRADGRELRPDGRDPLTERICHALGVDDASQIIPAVYAPGATRSRIAGLAPAVLAAAEDDPEVTNRLLRPAGAALAEMVAAVARALGWPSGPLPLAMAGGFLLSATAVAHALLNELNAAGYQVAATPVSEPVRGALILAERAWRAGRV